MRDHEEAFREAGVNLAAVGLGDEHYAKSFAEKSGIEFPLLIDAKRQAYRAAGLKKASLLHMAKPANLAAGKRAADAGHRQGKLGENPFQLGGSFVFGPGNEDRFVHLSETFGDNAPVVDLLDAAR